MRIHELKYSNTNTYLIESDKGKLLFDTGWAGTFPAFCSCMGDVHIPVQDIDYIMISHFHPDHMGIAQEIAELGATVVVMDVQKDYLHAADSVFAKDTKISFQPIRDERVRQVTIAQSREFLHELGIEGEALYTPGHSDDSISLWLDDGYLFVGDLNPLYELDLHKGTLIEESWKRLLELKPKTVYYGHAKTAVLDGAAKNAPDNASITASKNTSENVSKSASENSDLYAVVERIIKYIDKGFSMDKIQKKTGFDRTFIEDVNRMYLTHRNVGVQGILDRIEIKGR